MFPLLGPDLPATRDDFIAQLSAGLGLAFDLPPGRLPVVAEGGYPDFDRLTVDVSAAAVREGYRPGKPLGRGQPALSARRLETFGRQVRYGPVAADFELTAHDARLAFDRDERGQTVVYPVAAADGRFVARIRHGDLEALLLDGARKAAAAHDVTVEKTELSLACPGDREAAVDVRVTAAKKIAVLTARAVVHLRGRVTVDNDLNATLSGLTCTGEGALGTLVAGMVRGPLSRYEGRSFPLAAFSVGVLKLRDLRLRCERGLEVEGVFGS